MNSHLTTKEIAAIVEAIAKDLPDDETMLFARAKSAVELFNIGILSGDRAIAEPAAFEYDAVVYHMNGDDSLGTYGGPGSPGDRVMKHCAALPGSVPQWGQCGEFILETGGMRAILDVSVGIGALSLWPHFGFYAIDVDGPFISESGFQSVFPAISYGEPVNVVAKRIFEQKIASERRLLDQQNQKLCNEHLVRRAWLRGALGHRAPTVGYETESGQMAFAL